MRKDSLIIWYFSDQKPGHENQTVGLLRALKRYRALQIERFDGQSLSGWSIFWQGLWRQFSLSSQDVTPDLLIATGHRTHAMLWQAQRAFPKSRSVVLMKPSLPHTWFDLCVVPEHDGLLESERVILTKGVLNKVVFSKDKDKKRGLILLGGPSKHHHWDQARVGEQVIQIISRLHDSHWTVASSRRTPEETWNHLKGLIPEKQQNRVQFIAPDDVGKSWLAEQLQRAARVWVSEDSVSMLYEALTSGAVVGLIQLSRKKQSRVVRGVDQLIEQNYVTPFQVWQQNERALMPLKEPLQEADRVAQWIISKWFD
ncbi:mitochondrial fission ELM1 family protein [Magnetococcales bacterium HHB-1]